MDNETNGNVVELDSTIQDDSSEEGDLKPYTLVRQNAFSGKASFRYSLKLAEVRQIIESDFRGKTILSTYKKAKMLSPKYISLIVDIIISHYLKDDECR